MIDVLAALEGLDDYQAFPSVDTLLETASSLAGDARFDVSVAGHSRAGTPIHHVVFGKGRSVKALIVGGPHSMEPIGNLTVHALLLLLQRNCPHLVEADVEWHIVPCLDPDGARLNEGWTQQEFSFDTLMRERFTQAAADQPDQSFPIKHKGLNWTKPSVEAAVLRNIIDAAMPDFYFSLHSAWVGGAFFYLSRSLPPQTYGEIRDIVSLNGMDMHLRPFFKDVCDKFEDGFVEIIRVKSLYDYLEKNVPEPLDHIQAGTASWDYVSDTNPDALIFVAEIGHGVHPAQKSEAIVGTDLRRFMVEVEGAAKIVAAKLLSAWEEVKNLVDKDSPYYRPVEGGFIFPLTKDRVVEGAFPISWLPTRDLLFNDVYSHPMTAADRFNAAVVDGGYLLLLYSYQFLRLLRDSPKNAALDAVIERLEGVFNEALAEIDELVDLNAFEPFDHGALARVQLGSGLVALNSVLASRDASESAV